MCLITFKLQWYNFYARKSMVDRNVSKTLVTISLWEFSFKLSKKQKKTIFLIVWHGFLLTLNFLWGLEFYLLLMFCSVGVLLYVCIMNLRPIFARHFKLASMLTTLLPPCGAPILPSALFILILVSFILSYCWHKLGFRLYLS